MFGVLSLTNVHYVYRKARVRNYFYFILFYWRRHEMIRCMQYKGRIQPLEPPHFVCAMSC